MIPKIIHYTWFSGENFPNKIQCCIDSWKKILPDYDLRKWDMDAIKNIDSIFLKEAISARKWAYAADFVRLYAIYNYGGIYLDTDAEVYQSFDKFLKSRAFIGKENSIHYSGGICAQYLSSHCFGAEKGHPFVKMCLDYFKDRHFVTSKNRQLPVTLRYNFVLLPYIQAEIAQQYGYDPSPSNQNIQECENGLIIYPTEYFDMTAQTKNSYCRHLALGSWREKKPKEPSYTLGYKISWRIWAVIETALLKFNRKLLKLD